MPINYKVGKKHGLMEMPILKTTSNVNNLERNTEDMLEITW